MAELTKTLLTEDILSANKVKSFSVSTGAVTSGYVVTGLTKVTTAWANSVDSTTSVQLALNSDDSTTLNGAVKCTFASGDDFILTVLGI